MLTTKPYWLVAATILLLLAVFENANASGYHVFYSFKGTKAGADPSGSLVVDNAGNLYGTTVFGGRARNGGTAYKLSRNKEETILYQFSLAAGIHPQFGLIADNSGNLYGTTELGGTCEARRGCGTVFKIRPDGTETVLHSFQAGTDGYFPQAGLVMDGAGNLYGTTWQGGGGACECGTVFKVTPDGTETVLHVFQGGATDGELPGAGLILDSGGNLYGTTVLGGVPSYGTVFKLSPDGTETILYFFAGPSKNDGEQPWAPLVMDAAGNLYGTTIAGGDAQVCGVGVCGTVFKLSPDGKEKVLYAFHGGNDGFAAYSSGLVLDIAGNLYGVGYGGSGTGCGSSDGCGVVYKVSPHGKEKVLHTFEGGTADGWGPGSPLVFYNGELYGTTGAGGAYGYGTVFGLKP